MYIILLEEHILTVVLQASAKNCKTFSTTWWIPSLLLFDHGDRILYHIAHDLLTRSMWPVFCLQALPVHGSRLTVAQDTNRVDSSAVFRLTCTCGDHLTVHSAHPGTYLSSCLWKTWRKTSSSFSTLTCRRYAICQWFPHAAEGQFPWWKYWDMCKGNMSAGC